MTDSRAPRWQLITAFAAVYLIWGSTYLAIRFAIETLPPFFMAATRFLVAGALLYGFARWRGAESPTRRNWLAAALLGSLFLLLGNGGVVWAEQVVPSGLAALLVAVVPMWTVLIDWVRPGGRRPGATTVAGLAIGFAGVAFLIAPGDLVGGAGVNLVGAVVLMGATLAWSIGTVYSSRLPLPASPLLATGMEMLAGGAGLAVAGLLAGEAARVDLAGASLRSVGSLAYLIVFGSLVGFTAFVWLLRVTTPARVATYAYVNPVVAVVLGWALAGEPLTARTLVAAAGIVAAVVLIVSERSRAVPAKPGTEPAPVRSSRRPRFAPSGRNGRSRPAA